MKFGKYQPQVSRSDWGNERYIFQFENGYGASVIRNHLSYGGPEGFYELAVLKNGKIIYDTPITNDVVGWLDKNDVADTLKQIEEL
ncbi:hypothetical protein ACG98G_03145 [Megasphaera hexanoica]|uniref:Uncharacterized protein n=1 Tax=Megasphaera hexanoica TaxID=1675036 RepID=A0ABW7DKE8_9FIRM|nr:hypothetical protein [Megasphaera hexanoica]AXB82309.1 hypothetical protein ACT01_08700 [Megasphaera hexanoica]